MKSIGYSILLFTLLFVWLGEAVTLGDLYAKGMGAVIGVGLGVLFLNAGERYNAARRWR